MALPKSEKLKDRNSFRYQQQCKCLLKTNWFKLIGKTSSKSNEESKLPKVAFIIGRKKLKKAVHRNLVRRRCEEAYRRARLNSAMAEQFGKYEYLLFYLEVSALEVNSTRIETTLYKLLRRHA